MPVTCEHRTRVHVVEADSDACPDCVAMGSRWVHLRLCLECGYVGCCDSSVNKHTSAHVKATGHPVVRSLESGEQWAWCYVDDEFFESVY